MWVSFIIHALISMLVYLSSLSKRFEYLQVHYLKRIVMSVSYVIK